MTVKHDQQQLYKFYSLLCLSTLLKHGSQASPETHENAHARKTTYTPVHTSTYIRIHTSIQLGEAAGEAAATRAATPAE
jgi:hypothetical protein